MGVSDVVPSSHVTDGETGPRQASECPQAQQGRAGWGPGICCALEEGWKGGGDRVISVQQEPTLM